MKSRRRAVGWVKDDPFGVEYADIELADDQLRAEGVAIGTRPVPYRLDYRVETAPGLATSLLRVTSRGERWRRTLDLRRGDAGAWVVSADEDGDVDLPPAGGDPARLAGALDCDLGLSPVTNLMPILRQRLLSGGDPIELITAWVSVPDLSVRPDGQRYSHVRRCPDHHVVRYEAADGSFSADITLDRDGIVIDYPGIARRLM
ncbi:MAG TPA: putative glycolipid-binding domain-containing protein [Gaiellaceae bacterium]|nr:putative glycolipid-binding domain-containing protein [Gaiellaceae bacterium]